MVTLRSKTRSEEAADLLAGPVGLLVPGGAGRDAKSCNAVHPVGGGVTDVDLVLDGDEREPDAFNGVEIIAGNRAVRVRSNTADLDRVTAEAARLWPLTAGPASTSVGAGLGFSGGPTLHADRAGEETYALSDGPPLPDPQAAR